MCLFLGVGRPRRRSRITAIGPRTPPQKALVKPRRRWPWASPLPRCSPWGSSKNLTTNWSALPENMPNAFFINLQRTSDDDFRACLDAPIRLFPWFEGAWFRSTTKRWSIHAWGADEGDRLTRASSA